MDEWQSETIEALAGAWLVRVPIGEGACAELPGWASLLPQEQDFARDRKPLRQREFVAGRVALRAALQRAGWEGRRALLPRPSGAPDLPEGFTASLTHKQGLAFAVARPQGTRGTLGIDSEITGPRDRSGIARKVLRDSERARWESAGSGWPELLELFSVKEAIYKALYPHVPRYIGFEEAEIRADGGIELHLSGGEGPFALRSSIRWEGERLIALVEASPA